MLVRRHGKDHRGQRFGALACALGLLACGSRSGLDLALLEERDSAQLGARPPDAMRRRRALPQPPEATGCVNFVRRYTSTPPTVLLLIDQSASMRERFGASTRWDVLRTAIVDQTVGLLAWLDASANLGLMLYTSQDGFERGRECPLVSRVDVRRANAATIRSFYAGAEPFDDGDTPTADALDVAVDYLASVDVGPAKYVLLLTDGVPDTCAQPDPQDGFDAAVDAVVRARERGIIVRTVGVSPDIERDGLQRMANAGAGKALDLVFGRDDDAEVPLYASTRPSQLAAELVGAIGDVRSCRVALGNRVDDAHALDGRLLLDGRSLEYADPDGWSFEDADSISLHGEACRRILDDGQQLEVTFPCEPAGAFDDPR